MSTTPITETELINASTDAETFAEFLNSTEAKELTSRLLTVYPTLVKAIQNIGFSSGVAAWTTSTVFNDFQLLVTESGNTYRLAIPHTSGVFATDLAAGKWVLYLPGGLPVASTTVQGIVELATNAETQTGTDPGRAVTPAGLQSKVTSTTKKGIVELATNAETQAGTDTTRAITAAGLQSKTGVATDRLPLAQDVTLRSTGSEFAVYGGTANAITLATSRTLGALTKGMGFWFIPTVTNTGPTTANIDGIGLTTVLTITGVALPADYFLINTPTFMFYDGTNLICDRQDEISNNSGRKSVRHASGKMTCTEVDATVYTADSAVGSSFRSVTIVTFTFDKPFISEPAVTKFAHGSEITTHVWVGEGANTTTTAKAQLFGAITGNMGRIGYIAEGEWY